MKVLVLFVIILRMELIFSQQDCWLLDFNDPSVMTDVQSCYTVEPHPLQVQRMYNTISSQPTSFYPTSKYYLEAPPGWSCLTSKVFVYPNPETNYVLEMAVNQIIPYYSAFRIFLSSNFHSDVILNDDILGSTNGWKIFKYNLTFESTGGRHIEIYTHKDEMNIDEFVAIQYIKIYNPLTVNESCPVYQPPSKNSVCKTLDFNQPSDNSNEFVECEDLKLPILAIKPYANTNISPYRESSTFHLSSQTEGMSCMQLSESFALDSNSEISSAIYLNSLWPGSWVEIYVYDKNTGDRQVVLSVESNRNDWRFLTGRINRKFENAQIIIQSNANVHSGLAIEMLNVTRTDGKCY